MTITDDRIRAAWAALPPGYTQGRYEGRRYGLTVTVSDDGRRWWLFAEELGGTDVVSANLFVLNGDRTILKPCEMPEAKVKDFILGFRPDS